MGETLPRAAREQRAGEEVRWYADLRGHWQGESRVCS